MEILRSPQNKLAAKSMRICDRNCAKKDSRIVCEIVGNPWGILSRIAVQWQSNFSRISVANWRQLLLIENEEFLLQTAAAVAPRPLLIIERK